MADKKYPKSPKVNLFNNQDKKDSKRYGFSWLQDFLAKV